MTSWKTIATRWAVAGAVIGLFQGLFIAPAYNPGITAEDLGARTLGSMVGNALMWTLVGLIGTKIYRMVRSRRPN
jgi:hypothetical protein